MVQLEYAYDKFGTLLHRGAFITYPYKAGGFAGLRAGKVLDIIEVPTTLTWLDAQPGLVIISAGLWNGQWELGSRTITLKDATNTVYAKLPWAAQAVFASAEIVPYRKEQELKICL